MTSPARDADALTDIGIEAEGVEEVQSIKGGLEGLVIGKVLTCTRHPNSDHLHLTTVDIGDGAEPLNIVCGAPNVAAGQKVVVAPIGTKLYDDDKVFTIKRTKIRARVAGHDLLGEGNRHRHLARGHHRAAR